MTARASSTPKTTETPITFTEEVPIAGQISELVLRPNACTDLTIFGGKLAREGKHTANIIAGQLDFAFRRAY